MEYIGMTGLPRRSKPRVSHPRGDSKLGDFKEAFPCGHEGHQPWALHPATPGQGSPRLDPASCQYFH